MVAQSPDGRDGVTTEVNLTLSSFCHQLEMPELSASE